MKVKISDIIYREDLYPRFKPNQQYISIYSQAIDNLPPIKISQGNILIDGFHRLKAHELCKLDEIEVEIIEVSSEKEIKKLAYKYNSTHGLQLTQAEKESFANEMIGELMIEELSIILSVSDRTIKRWTETKRKQIEKRRNQLILEDYLRAWNTEEGIGGAFDLSKQAVSEIINKSKNGHLAEIGQDFQPYIYNIWNLQKQDNFMPDRFGSFPNIFMENLFYYHTKPFDIIFDPFAGGGTTVDVCQKMLRRYYCSDREVTPGREKDIRKHEIQDGIPSDLPKPKLVFLDPPYSILAKGKYSENDDDLGNIDVKQFYEIFNEFVIKIADWKVNKIAYVIRPFWITNNGASWEWSDPMFEIYSILKDKYKIATRYILPYSTQQYSGLWVERAKNNNKCLILNRELTVFEVI